MKSAIQETMPSGTAPADLLDLAIGGLALHGEIPAHRFAELAMLRGHDTAGQARTILDLIGAGLASVQRDGSGGAIIATPALRDHPRRDVCRAILVYLCAAKSGGRADA